ncbi:hypothetical protein M0R04_10545 [Candidatus Dojkabacteria bacterium]|jgi:hypothetical protein|nr:hypothetical protein [Candidatus Dojkabacteria bacterium]
MNAISQNFSAFQEDVSTLAAGSTIVAQPCRVFSITATVEADGDPIISISDSEGYNPTYRFEKIVLSAETKTHTITYPTGKYCARGVSATSNRASVDISVIYE